jgi:hypothetical protein
MHWLSYPFVLAYAVLTSRFDRDIDEEEPEAFPWAE